MLPPIDTTQLPADVRAAGPQAQKVYQAALGFERQLLQQLTQQLAASATSPLGGDEEEGDTAGAASGYAKGLIPDALADGLIHAGGLGVARELYRQLTPETRS